MNPLSKEEAAKIVEFISWHAKTAEDVHNIVKQLVWPTLESLMKAELDEHLWYKKSSKDGYNSWDSRNWSYKKKIRTTAGETDIDVPRDRNWDFHPQVIPRFETNTSEVEQKIINMYALGLTTWDIVGHIQDIYGANISASMVSSITDKILPEIKEWQSRPLEKCYPIIYLDAIHYNVKSNGKYENKAVYIIIWIGISWKKDVLSLIVGENESASFWQKVCNDLTNRWVADIMIACIDGLTWFKDAIKNVFPDIEIQRCIIHQIRSSMKYVNYKDTKNFMKDLKLIYQADTLELAEIWLENLQKNRTKKYPISVNSWVNNWADLSTYFVYPPNIRKIIYTTNTIEGYNRQLRKITKTTSVFPTEDSLLKLLYLATKNITKKRTTQVRDRGNIIWQLESFFPNRITKYLD